MSDDGQKTAWSIVVDAGPYSRRALPVSVSLSISADQSDKMGPPLLVREGRQRPLPCQLTVTDAEVRAVWLVDSMKAGEQCKYRLSFGERQRQSPTRMHIDKSPTGWTVAEDELRFVDYLTPVRGTPRLTIQGSTGPLANLQHLAMPRWMESGSLARGTIEGERALHRVQSQPVAAQNGPVFATLHTDYDYVDRLDRKIVTEACDATFFLADRGTRVIDLTVRWEAVAEGLTLIDPDIAAYQRLPVLRLTMTEPITEQIMSDAGRVGMQETLGRMAGGITVEQKGSKLGLIARSATLGFPPRWERGEESSLNVVPGFLDSRWLGSAIRLALGECWSMSYRIVVGPAAASKLGSLTSFDVEPTVAIFSD